MVQTHHSERGRSQKNELHRGPGCHVPALTRACGILSSGIFGSCQGHLPAAKAFDVVSNYMAVQECKDVCMAEHQPLVSWILLLILDECDIFFWRTVKTHPPFQGKFLHHFFYLIQHIQGVHHGEFLFFGLPSWGV